jgi:phytoene dehydrogenase-like protein
MKRDVVIVGAGLSGLCCAQHVQRQNRSLLVLESSDAVGGRIRTDSVDGFQLDRGFQVFLSSYPEARQMLDFDALDLHRFEPGALVRYQGRFFRLTDPWRNPLRAIGSAFSPIGSFRDKLRVGALRQLCLKNANGRIPESEEMTTRDYLRQFGFSDLFIRQFFEPFLGGIFLDRSLETSCRMLQFVFGMFALGDATLPAKGMQSIPEQLKARLAGDTVRFHTTVRRIGADHVELSSGERIEAKEIVLATDAPATAQILKESGLLGPDTGFELREPGTPLRSDGICSAGRGVTCLYFGASRSPLRDRLLVLNGESTGPINNLCVVSDVVPSYAPAGKSLISVTLLGIPADLELTKREVWIQLEEWFGHEVKDWEFIRYYSIPYALPDQTSPALQIAERPVQIRDGLYVCGDHRDNASIQGAMVSGRRAAAELLQRSSTSH